MGVELGQVNLNNPVYDYGSSAVIKRTCVYLAVKKPHLLKSKGGIWHVAYLSTVPWNLVKAAILYRNDVLLKGDKSK